MNKKSMLVDPAFSTVFYIVAESTFKTNLLVKLGVDDLNSRVDLINPPQYSAIQIFLGLP